MQPSTAVEEEQTMADLTTTYLGMTLRTPLVPSASPLSEDIGNIKRMEDAGASAVVLYSLFEEQVAGQHHFAGNSSDSPTGIEAEIAGYFPHTRAYYLEPEGYLNHIRRAKESVAIPVIASLNASSAGGWTEYAKQLQQAGADALELNIYYVPTAITLTGSQVERTYVEIVEEVRSAVHIPLAVKLSPYFSNMANIAWRLERVGADALVLFNRFYQPDFNLESMQVTPRLLLSTPQAMRLPLRWIAILHGRVHLDLAATGGIHEAYDVAKMLMAGASITMLCSALLRRGIDYLRPLEAELNRWLDAHGYASVTEIQGLLSQQHVADPEAFERAHYIRALQSYERPGPQKPARSIHES
jgi:dihydroorotate dehydrogenase (fumarate)